MKTDRKIIQQRYREKNKELLKQRNKEYKEKNKELIVKNNKEYKEKNKERDKVKKGEHDKRYREQNKDKVAKRKKEYYESNKEKRREYFREYKKKRKENDKLYFLKEKYRNILYKAIKYKTSKNGSSESILGCSFEEFKLHLESKFESWMNWDNYGLYNGTSNYGWDIDHIIPLTKAMDEEMLLNLNHFTNLQPLCSYINRDIKKGG
jgi:hypothetical protein